MTIGEWLTEYVKVEADDRHQLHQGHASSRPLSDDYEYVGLAGEFEFGRLIGLMPDLERKPGGDKGIDFVVRMPFSVDVKTARKAGNLIHEQGKPFVDVYVLAEYDETTKRARLVGWEWGAKLRAAPVKDFGHGVVSHYIPRAQLKPMAELVRRIKDAT